MLRIIVVNEFIGTAILILLGCGIGALVSLTFSLGHQAGNWVLTSLGWGWRSTSAPASRGVRAPTSTRRSPWR